VTVRCLICNAPGAFICEKKHDDDESDRAALGRVHEWERIAEERAGMNDAETGALAGLAVELRRMGFSAVAILMRSVLAAQSLRGKSDEEVLAAMEAPGEIDPLFAPRVMKVLADLRRAGVPRSLVRVVPGSPEIDLAEEVPLLAKLALARAKDPAKNLRRLADAIALGKRRPRQRLAAEFNRDVLALRVGKRVQEVLEAAHRAAPKGQKTSGALAPFVREAIGSDAYADRLTQDLAVYRRERWPSLRELAALFVHDAREGRTSPRHGEVPEKPLERAEAELRRLEKLPLTVARVGGNAFRETGFSCGPDESATTPHGMKSRRRKPDGREAHEHRGSRRGPSRQSGEHPTDAVGRLGTAVHPSGKASLVRTGGRPRLARSSEEDLDVRPRPGRVTKAKRRPPP
jgi:hypothetical protein